MCFIDSAFQRYLFRFLLVFPTLLSYFLPLNPHVLTILNYLDVCSICPALTCFLIFKKRPLKKKTTSKIYLRLTILTIFKCIVQEGQLYSQYYIISRTFSSCKTETSYSLNSAFPPPQPCVLALFFFLPETIFAQY